MRKVWLLKQNKSATDRGAIAFCYNRHNLSAIATVTQSGRIFLELYADLVIGHLFFVIGNFLPLLHDCRLPIAQKTDY